MTKQKSSSWYVYMVRCKDNSLYTGITTDLIRREQEHNNSVKGAKYTRVRRPVIMVFNQAVASRSAAAKLEVKLKKLTKIKKEQLIIEKKPCLP